MSRKLFCLFLLFIAGATAFSQIERDSVHIILDLQELRHVKTADLDGDGDLDLIGSRNGFNGQFVVHEHLDGQGSFAPPLAFGNIAWNDFIGYIDFQLGDMDNDGDLDIVPHLEARDAQPYWQNNSDLSFTAPDPTGAFPEGGNDNYFFQLIDLDQNGWLDILVYLPGSRTLSVNWNMGPGLDFDYEVLANLSPLTNELFLQLTLTDHDLDGDIDLSFLTYRIEGEEKVLRLHQFTQTCAGCFEETSVQALASSGIGFQTVELSTADLDQDAYLDLLVGFQGNFQDSEQDYARLIILRNNAGDGTYDNVLELDNYVQHTLSDFNQDGLPDLFAVFDNDQNYRTNGEPEELFAYHWLENTGNFTFTAEEIDKVWSGRTLLAVDLDQDGLTDLLHPEASSLPHGEVVWRRALSETEFSPPLALDITLEEIPFLEALDWDNDNDLDLLTTSSHHFNECCPDGLYWIENLDGMGAYGPPQLLMNLSGSWVDLKFTDLNGDGHTDFFGTQTYTDAGPTMLQSFYWFFEANSDTVELTFLPPSPLADWPTDFVIGDIEADGDPDLLGLDDDWQLVLVRNDGAAGFQVETDFLPAPSVDFRSKRVFLADIDQNGRDDILYCTLDSVYWAHQLEDGAFEAWTGRQVAPYNYSLRLGISDFDSDGDLDLKFPCVAGPGLMVWAAMEYDSDSQGFLPARTIEWNLPYRPLFSILPLNDDGTPDILSQHGFSVGLPGTLYQSTAVLPTPFTNQLPDLLYFNATLADVDGDGQDELISGQHSLLWYELDFVPGRLLEGLLLQDPSMACEFDSIHPPLKGWNILVESGELSQLTTTNTDGHYTAALPLAAEHEVEVIPLSSYWTVCDPDTLIEDALIEDIATAHFTAIANTDCPLLRVEMRNSPFRQCFDSWISIQYHNVGTQAVEDAEIRLLFDPRFTPIASNLPWTSLDDTLMTFEFPEIGIGDLGTIHIQFEPDCAALELGEEVCFRMEVLPDTLCENMGLAWNGAQLEAAAFCEGDSLAFHLMNTGEGSMTAPQSYRLDIVNDDIVLFLMDNTQLGAGETDTIRVALPDQLVRFSIDQPSGHPFPEPVSLLVNSCDESAAPGGIGHPAFTPNLEGDPFVQEICGEIIGPYDPNIKTAQPTGLGPEHGIDADWRLHYTIHFQNTGSDTAQTVVLRDTLSPLLDLSSFRAGPSSHPCEWTILPGGELRVTYPHINLPDSTANEAASHGHFSYSILPQEDALPLTTIENRAGIYFDFNPPIMTNTTIHTIRKPRIETVVEHVLCQGDIYLGQSIAQDTVLTEIFSTPDRDSVVFHWLSVDHIPPTEVQVEWTEAGSWQGIWIGQDTTITRIETGHNGCDSLIHYQFNILTDLHTPAWASTLEISPNPADELVNLSWEKHGSRPTAYRIIDVAGREWKKGIIPVFAKNYQLSVRRLPPGIYYLEVWQGKEYCRHRFAVI